MSLDKCNDFIVGTVPLSKLCCQKHVNKKRYFSKTKACKTSVRLLSGIPSAAALLYAQGRGADFEGLISYIGFPHPPPPLQAFPRDWRDSPEKQGILLGQAAAAGEKLPILELSIFVCESGKLVISFINLNACGPRNIDLSRIHE